MKYDTGDKTTKAKERKFSNDYSVLHSCCITQLLLLREIERDQITLSLNVEKMAHALAYMVKTRQTAVKPFNLLEQVDRTLN